MSSKSRKVNLFYNTAQSDATMELETTATKTYLKSANALELEGQSIKLVHAADANKNVDDLCTFLSTLGTASAINTEAASRAAAITSEANSRAAAITAEANARANAITSEASARAAAITAEETRCNNAIAAESANLTSHRIAAFSALSSGLASEATTRASETATLTSAVNTEKSRIDAMLAGSSINLDTLAEVVAAYQAADTTTLATIAALQTQVNDLQATVDTLTDEA